MRQLLITLCIILAVALLIAFNLRVIPIRMSEFEKTLAFEQVRGSMQSTEAVTAQFQLLHNRRLYGDTAVDNALLEATVKMLNTYCYQGIHEADTSSQFDARIVLPFMKVMQNIGGKDGFTYSSTSVRILDLALLHGQYRDYRQALDFYNQVPTPLLRQWEILPEWYYQKALCHALLFEPDSSLQLLASIQAEFPLDHIATLAKEASTIVETLYFNGDKKLNSRYDQAKQAFYERDFIQSVNLFEYLLGYSDKLPPQLEDELNYYLARSYEEAGDDSTALRGYESMVTSASNPQWKKAAGRRLKMLASFDSPIQKNATFMVEAYAQDIPEDKSFEKELQAISEISKEVDIDEEIIFTPSTIEQRFEEQYEIKEERESPKVDFPRAVLRGPSPKKVVVTKEVVATAEPSIAVPDEFVEKREAIAAPKVVRPMGPLTRKEKNDIFMHIYKQTKVWYEEHYESYGMVNAQIRVMLTIELGVTGDVIVRELNLGTFQQLALRSDLEKLYERNPFPEYKLPKPEVLVMDVKIK